MVLSKLKRFFLCFFLVAITLASLAGQAALAQTATDRFELTCSYPVLRGESGDSFAFAVNLYWIGSEARNFDLIATVPDQWTAKITRDSPPTEVAAIRMEANRENPQEFQVTVSSVSWNQPQPGEYVITIEAISGDLKKTIDLKAVVRAIYGFRITTENGNANLEARAGNDNTLVLLLVNTGTARIENITFASTQQASWGVTFFPDRVAALDPGVMQAVNVTIRPPNENGIAGDYKVTLRAESKDYLPDPIDIRVTVTTAGYWWWIIAAAIVVVVGVGIFFWRSGRRPR